MTIPCYALGMQFKEALGCGKDDQFQLANSTNCERYAEFKYTKEDKKNVQMPQRQSEFSARPVSLGFGLSKA